MIRQEQFKESPCEREIAVFTLTNSNGLAAKIMTYGGILMSLHVPDRDGTLSDIVLGYNAPKDYACNDSYFGALIGRYANRISNARFTLAGTTYKVTRNEGRHHLHGGRRGFDKVVWDAERVTIEGREGIQLRHCSKNGDEGYPGNLVCNVRYSLTDEDELWMEYEAHSDKPTPVNITNHTFFNLNGHASGAVYDHIFRIGADHYAQTDAALIPTGKIVAVKGTPLDFKRPVCLSSVMSSMADGFDHSYVLDKSPRSLGLAASVSCPTSGRVLEVYTTYPSVQFYTGNRLNGSVIGKEGAVYRKHAGFCLETQHLPDAPNRPEFPSVIIRPGDVYQYRTIFHFIAEQT